MRFLLDHDVPDRIAEVLRQAGHSVLLLREALPKEAEDAAILRHAVNEQRILVTRNRDDFLSLARTEPHAGLIILIRRKSRIAECASLLQLIDRAGEAGLSKNVNFA